MKKYIGVKEIGAKPMTRGEHSTSKGFDKVLVGKSEDEGYQVIYSDGYESWSPKEVFEKSYVEIESTSEEALSRYIESNLDGKAITDGYHTRDELYNFRKMYNAALFNEWGEEHVGARNLRESIKEEGFDPPIFQPKYNVHKSLRHHDGELCFGGGWFIVVAMLPDGQISNHYKMEDWDLFKIPETNKALFEFDGHTGEDVLKRLKNI